MASIAVLMSKLVSMMLMVVAGYVIVRCGVLKSTDSKVLSRITVYLLQPCLIARAFQIDVTPERLRGFASALILGMASYLVLILLTRLLRRPLGLDPIDETTLIYSNVGNLILPLVSMVLGDEYVFYASAMQIPFNLFIWTHGASVIRGSRGVEWKKILLNTNMIALVVGVALFLLHIRIPDVLDTAMGSLAGMVGPTSMLVVGMVIAGSDVKRAFINGRAYLIVLGRLIIAPMISMLLLFVSGYLRANPELVAVLQVTFMALAAPPASTVSQLAVLYDQKPEEASIYNVLGMALSIVTIPLVIAIYQAVFAH